MPIYIDLLSSPASVKDAPIINDKKLTMLPGYPNLWRASNTLPKHLGAFARGIHRFHASIVKSKKFLPTYSIEDSCREGFSHPIDAPQATLKDKRLRGAHMVERECQKSLASSHAGRDTVQYKITGRLSPMRSVTVKRECSEAVTTRQRVRRCFARWLRSDVTHEFWVARACDNPSPTREVFNRAFLCKICTSLNVPITPKHFRKSRLRSL